MTVKPWSRLKVTTALLLAGGLAALAAPAPQSVVAVSVPQLLNNLDRYSGQLVQVYGYLSCTGNIHLFATREHAQMRDFMSAILVSDSDDGSISSRCCESHAKLVGPFTLTEKSERILGPLRSVTLLELRDPPEPPHEKQCWPPVAAP